MDTTKRYRHDRSAAARRQDGSANRNQTSLTRAAPFEDWPDATQPLLRRTPTSSKSRTIAVVQNLGRGLILAGIVVFLFVAYQLWGTNFREARAQDDLRDQLVERFEFFAGGPPLDRPLVDVPSVPEIGMNEAYNSSDEGVLDYRSGSADEVTATAIHQEVDDELLGALFPAQGAALAQINIPSIDVAKVVVQGVAVADLRKGPGHYDDTSLPGSPGNAAIAGHRTTYGAPFKRIDELMPGDEITVTSIQGEFTYRVSDPRKAYAKELDQVEGVGTGHIIVKPSAVWVLGDFGDDRLTLTACHPKLSSRQRIIVAAELVDDAVELPDWVLQAGTERAAPSGEDSSADTDARGATVPTEDSSVLGVREPDGEDVGDRTTAPVVSGQNAAPDLDQ